MNAVTSRIFETLISNLPVEAFNKRILKANQVVFQIARCCNGFPIYLCDSEMFKLSVYSTTFTPFRFFSIFCGTKLTTAKAHRSGVNPSGEANLEVIRLYLLGQFKGFELTDTPNHPLSHTFTATKSSDERFQLKVSRPQLSDIGNTPENTKKRLVTDDVAGRMRGKSQGEYFSWGKH